MDDDNNTYWYIGALVLGVAAIGAPVAWKLRQDNKQISTPELAEQAGRRYYYTGNSPRENPFKASDAQLAEFWDMGYKQARANAWQARQRYSMSGYQQRAQSEGARAAGAGEDYQSNPYLDGRYPRDVALAAEWSYGYQVGRL